MEEKKHYGATVVLKDKIELKKPNRYREFIQQEHDAFIARIDDMDDDDLVEARDIKVLVGTLSVIMERQRSIIEKLEDLGKRKAG